MIAPSFKQKLQAGSFRVFNCLEISETICQDNDPALCQLLFQHAGLNRFIFLKDVALDWQNDEFADKSHGAARPVATKAFWPFDNKFPFHGGESIFCFEPDYLKTLQTKAWKFGHDWRRDRLILGILQDLPSFDPFLIKDRIRQLGFEVDPRYFAITPEEWGVVRDHLRARLEPWVTIAYGRKCPTFDKSDLVIDRIWLSKDESHFFPLKKLLRLSAQDCGPLLDAWKGIAYFHFRYDQQLPRIRALAEWLGAAATMIDGTSCLSYGELQDIIKPLRGQYRRYWGQAMTILDAYDQACERVYRYRQPDDFIHFMRDANQHFHTLGHHLSRLYDAIDIWEQLTLYSDCRRLQPKSWLMFIRDLARIMR